MTNVDRKLFKPSRVKTDGTAYRSVSMIKKPQPTLSHEEFSEPDEGASSFGVKVSRAVTPQRTETEYGV